MLCVVFATFSLHRELPNMILGDEPLLSQGGGVYHTLRRPETSRNGDDPRRNLPSR
jgi:hypothetical protein